MGHCPNFNMCRICLCVGGHICYCHPMRRNAITGEMVLELDVVGKQRGTREMECQWDPDALFQEQDRWAQRLWEMAGRPASWDRTIVRLPPEWN